MTYELNWYIPEDAEIEDISFEWDGNDLSLSENLAAKLKSGTIHQVQPWREDQPWGIFLLEYDGKNISVTLLRQILRRLVTKKIANTNALPTWKLPNLLFICSGKDGNLTFAHFMGDKPHNARLTTFGWAPEEAIRTLCEFNLPALEYKPEWTPEKWLQEWQNAFDVEKVTDKFFNEYLEIFEHLQGILYEQAVNQDKNIFKAQTWAHDYALQFLNRLMFLYFIQKKKLIGNDGRFIRHYWDAYKRSKQSKDTFFKDWLSVLFFEAFNNQYHTSQERKIRFGNEIDASLMNAPYLNGGLFSTNDLDKVYSVQIGDEFFEVLFDEYQGKKPGFLESYNFTISETTPLDQEVAVDPEMIGKVYEKLVNITFEGIADVDRRGNAGIFYTPRVEIDLMCRLALADNLANHLGEKYKPLLYDVVFAYSPEDKLEADKKLVQENLWVEVEKLLKTITVCDPACGSGSFLIGMLLVLDDLIERAESHTGEKKASPFERRKEIIARSLYGVDVMPWAVHVAELRLWLQLVIETPLNWYEHKAEPMLPNLSFKVRPGDSLVQDVGGIIFQLDKTPEDAKAVQGTLTQLKADKLKYFRNDKTPPYKDKATLEHDEIYLFEEILKRKYVALGKKIVILDNEIREMSSQASWTGMGRPAKESSALLQKKQDLENLQQELQKVNKALQALQSTDKNKLPFVWDIAFVEIFKGEKQGFDIVIGNPPYVRQEKIAPPLEKPEDYGGENSARWKREKTEYKARLQNAINQAYPKFFNESHKIDSASDLYIYFYLLGLKLLNRTGTFCFITSNSWLDVGFGKDLQEFLLKHCQIKMILDNSAKRTFSNADINSVIVLFSSPGRMDNLGLDCPVKFVSIKIPFEEALSPIIFDEISGDNISTSFKEFKFCTMRGQQIKILQLSREEFTLRQLSNTELLKDDIIIEEENDSENKLLDDKHKYYGNKWGSKYLRMPEFLYPLIESKSLISLGTICDLERGKTSGITDFFIIGFEKATKLGIEKQFLIPVINSTKQVESLVIKEQNLENFMFICPYSLYQLEKLKYHGAAKYVRWGREQVTKKKGKQTTENVPWPNVPTVRNNKPEWHCIKLKSSGDFIVPRLIRERFFFASNPDLIPDTDMFFHGRFKDRNDALVGSIVLNSTITYLMLEIFGRQNIEGRFNIYGPELKPLFIPNPKRFNEDARRKLQQHFKNLTSREVKKIFPELGLPEPCDDKRHPLCNINPEDVSMDKVLPDRRELDKAVFEAIGLTNVEQLEVYQALVTLVKNRLVKAQSV